MDYKKNMGNQGEDFSDLQKQKITVYLLTSKLCDCENTLCDYFLCVTQSFL